MSDLSELAEKIKDTEPDEQYCWGCHFVHKPGPCLDRLQEYPAVLDFKLAPSRQPHLPLSGVSA